MGNKYLETKPSSLEESILGMWEEQAAEMDGRKKNYKEHRAKLEARRIKKEKLTAKQKKLDVDGDGEIEASDLAALRAKAKKAKKESYKTSHEMWVDALKEVRSSKKAAKLKSDHDPDEDADTGKKSDKIKINPTLENFELQEGRMKELSMLIKQGKSAEEIAKTMKVDAKTIKTLMSKE